MATSGSLARMHCRFSERPFIIKGEVEFIKGVTSRINFWPPHIHAHRHTCKYTNVHPENYAHARVCAHMHAHTHRNYLMAQ